MSSTMCFKKKELSAEEKVLLQDPKRHLEKYYNSLETRLGFRLLLGNYRHLGYYHKDTLNPFPLHHSLNNMEDRLASTLDLPPSSLVLDAGCGSGRVAMRLASHWGLRIEAIDILPDHLADARKRISRAGLNNEINVRLMSYQNLSEYPKDTFDGVYSSASMIHSGDLLKALREMKRVMKPGAHLAFHDFDMGEAYKATAKEVHYNNIISQSLVARNLYPIGGWKVFLEEAGFEDVAVRDITKFCLPMLRFFWAMGILPYAFARALGIQNKFPNTVAAVKGWQHWKRGIGWRVVEIEARKPVVEKVGRIPAVVVSEEKEGERSSEEGGSEDGLLGGEGRIE